MKKFFTMIAILVSAFFINDLNAQPWIANLPKGKLQSGELTFYEIQKAFNDYWDPLKVENGYYKNENGEEVKALGWKQFKRWEWYWDNRIVKETGQFPKTSASEELGKYLLENPQPQSPAGNWTSLGPTTSTGGYAGLGRLNCAAFISGDNNTIYVGSPSGGIWKTADGGTNWIPIGDHNAVIGVSDIVAYRPASLPDVIYIATGDKDGGSMWSLGGGQSNDNNSVGVLKSTDGGTNWNTTGLSFVPSQKQLINRLLIHPSDNNILYAATSAGVYKTINGGTNWSLLSATEFIDMEFKPGTPSIIYGSTKGGVIYRSINDGTTWTATLSTANARTELAVSANNPAIVYAVVANTSNGLAGIYKSTDSGASFTLVLNGATNNILNNACGGTTGGGQAWYDLCIAADPTNADIVFVGGVNTWKSVNGGTVWTISSHWSGSCSVQAVHADKHSLVYQNGTSTLFECNDGGVYKTINNGTNWIAIGNGLIISQLYRLGVAQTIDNENIIGLQDNGTKSFLSGVWSDEIGGDGFECIIDYTNQNTLYGELYYGDIYRSTNHGVSWTHIISGLTGSAWWCAPYVIDPNVNTTLYMGYQDVFKSTNQGTAWTKISFWSGDYLKVLAVAPSNSLYIYAGKSSILYRTIDGGTTWTNITGTIPVASGNITYISVKNNDPNTAWVTLGGYNSTRVFQTTDGGTTWTDISAGLPSIPVMCVVQNKQNTSQVELYAGTDVGVYVKVGAANWAMFSTGLPNVVVNELEIYYNATPSLSRLRAATSGRGLWQSELYSLPPVTANFVANTTTPAINTQVNFTDNSSGFPTNWSWSFSPSSVLYLNGTTSASQNPQVQFVTTDPYTVSLTASNSLSSDVEIKTNYINPVICNPCASTSNNATEEWISNVTFNSINNTSAGGAGYEDFTGISTILTPGSTYSLSITCGQISNYTENAWAFIDWNHNCDFTDPGESYDLGQVSGPGTMTISVTVPTGAIAGATRLRASLKYFYDPTSCEIFNFGQVEDYTLNVLCTPCASTSTNANEEWISNVTFNTINNTSAGIEGYQDFTGISTNVAPGSTYSLSITCGQISTYTENAWAFIDWNHNCDFTDPGESYDLGQVSGPGTMTISVTVPTGAVAGATRLRASLKYATDPTPCETFTFGQVEDYILNVQPLSRTLTLKVFLEGLYNGASTMRQAFDETGPHFGSGIADHVTVELHNSTAPYATVYTFTNLNLNTNGTIIINPIPAGATASYYVVIKHRNSIETWSNVPLSFSGTGPYNFDFSTAASQAYGSNMKTMGSVFAVWGGDVNQDGIVDTGDMNPVENASTNFIMGYIVQDVNGDGIVDTGDMNIVENNSTDVIQVMSP
jgi:PKD repeat protein